MTSLDNSNDMLYNNYIEPFLVLYFLPIDYLECFKYENGYNNLALLRPFLINNHDGGNEVICPERAQKKVSLLLSSVESAEYYHIEIYPSLTDKFLDLADSIESEAYFISDTQHGRILSIDTNKICYKRRSKTNKDDYLDLGEGTSVNGLGSL